MKPNAEAEVEIVFARAMRDLDALATEPADFGPLMGLFGQKLEAELKKRITDHNEDVSAFVTARREEWIEHTKKRAQARKVLSETEQKPEKKKR